MDNFVRIRPALLKWPTAVEDADAVPENVERLRLTEGFKSYDRLKSLPRLKALWCFGIDQKKLEHIGDCSHLEELHLDYRLNASSLQPIKNLPLLRILTLNSCFKMTSLSEISEFQNLEGLLVENFKNVRTMDEVSALKNLKQLGISGSIWTRMTIEALKPLEDLTSLEYLDLTNTKVNDESLKPIGQLSQLKLLDIANFYPMTEFASLAAKLPKTRCDWFSPYIRTNLQCQKCGNNSRVMLTGKGKPMLCSSCDAVRLRRHVEEFEEIRRAKG